MQSFSFIRETKTCPHFYCNNDKVAEKSVPYRWMCDNDRDCPNAEDEKYCRLTMKYKESDIKNGIKLVGG